MHCSAWLNFFNPTDSVNDVSSVQLTLLLHGRSSMKVMFLARTAKEGIWRLIRRTGHQTTHNQSHLQLIINFWAVVSASSYYTNINISIFQLNQLYEEVRGHICVVLWTKV